MRALAALPDFPHCARLDAGGEVWVPRPDPAAEAWLDARLARVRPWLLRWVPGPQENEMWAEEWAEWPAARVVLYGKGPGLVGALADPPDGLQVCVNEAALLLPHADAVFYEDVNVGLRLGGQVPPGCPHVTPIAARELPWEGPPRLLWRWADKGDPSDPRPRHGHATAPAALAVLAGWGARDFLLVGFDAYRDRATWDQEAPSYPPEVLGLGVPQRPHSHYEKINVQIDDVIGRLGLRIEVA